MNTATTLNEQRADVLKKHVCKMLNWTEMQFAEYQYQNGIAYLMWYLPCDDWARQQLERSKLYWSWFKNQWTLHDESLLSFQISLTECSHRTLMQLYDDLHCPRALAVDVKPNRVVLDSIKKREAAL